MCKTKTTVNYKLFHILQTCNKYTLLSKATPEKVCDFHLKMIHNKTDCEDKTAHLFKQLIFKYYTYFMSEQIKRNSTC